MGLAEFEAAVEALHEAVADASGAAWERHEDSTVKGLVAALNLYNTDELQRFWDALSLYGSHLWDCPISRRTLAAECECGFARVLDDLKKLVEGRKAEEVSASASSPRGSTP